MTESLDLQTFQAEVDRELRVLVWEVFMERGPKPGPDEPGWWEEENERYLAEILQQKPWRDYSSTAAVARSAEEVVERKDVRVYLCPALQAVSDDAFDIAKVATPVLVGLVVAGTVTIPLAPALFATVAFIISRMGVASLCVGFEKKDKSSPS